jgi:hypothetical protein
MRHVDLSFVACESQARYLQTIHSRVLHLKSTFAQLTTRSIIP